MKLPSKKVEILLLEGTPSGLRYADIKTKVIRAFVSPRASFRELLKRPELENAGVYVLFGRPTDSTLPQIYIGEADVLSTRLPMHNSKEFWSDIIVFLTLDETFDKAGVRYLESMLVNRATQDKLAELQNGNTPAIKNISEANVAVMDDCIEDIIFLLTVLGYPVIRSKTYQVETSNPLLYIKGIGQTATGRETDEGFVVYKDSTARIDNAPSVGKSESKMREHLITSGVLQKVENSYIFTQEYLFSSPSLAAGVILGRNSNGRNEWKSSDGKTLNELSLG